MTEPQEKTPLFDPLRLLSRRKRKSGEKDKYATLNQRMLAATIDSLIIMLTLAPLLDMAFNAFYGPLSLDFQDLLDKIRAEPDQSRAMEAFWQALHESGYFSRWLANAVSQVALLAGFSAVFWHFWAATPGKMLLRLKIVDAKTGQPISDRQIAWRVVGYFISSFIFCLGFLWIGLDKRRQGWHDKMADTVVIKLPWLPKKEANSSSFPGEEY